MWGKLPVPKYIAHVIYADNPAGETALKAGEVDVCQQFIANIQDLWLKDNLPISTYMDKAPYGICVNMMSILSLQNRVLQTCVARVPNNGPKPLSKIVFILIISKYFATT